MKMNSVLSRVVRALAILPASVFVALSLPAPAATISLGTSDTGTATSFASGTNWTGGAAPISGNAYLVGGGLTLQTATGTATQTFAGDSLTIGDGGATAATFLYKGGGSTVTVGSLFLNNGLIQTSASTPTFSGGTITLLAGGGTLDTITNGHSIVVSEVISGSGPLTLEASTASTAASLSSGAGAITLSGANTYTGATLIAADTKATVGNVGAFANSSSMTLNAGSILEGNAQTYTINNLSGTGGILDGNAGTGSGSTVTINQTADGTFAGSIAWNGTGTGTFNVTKTGAGTLTLSGANTWNNSATVSNGTLKIDASTGSLASTVALKMGGSTFSYDNTNTTSGAKSQTLASVGFTAGDNVIQSTLGGASSSALTFGTMTAALPSNVFTANFVTAGGTNGVNNSINLTVGTATGFLGENMFFDGADYAYLTSVGGYVRAAVYDSDAGFVTAGASLSSGNHNRMTSSITGQTAVTVNTIKFDTASEVDLTMSGSSVLTLAKNGLLRSGGGATTISGGSIVTSITGSTNYLIRTDTAADSLTINSTIANNGGNVAGLVKSGAGILTLGGTNTYSGTTTIDGGILSISQNVNLGNQVSPGAVTINNGTLQATGTFGLYQGTAGTNDRAVTLANNAAIGVTGSNALTIHGVVSGTGSLAKVNTGTLILSGANIYTGATTVNAGTLLVNGSLASGSAVTVNAGGILGGTGTIGGALTLASGGFVAPGAAGAIGTLAGTSFLWNGGGAMNVDLGAAAASDLLNLSGAFTKGAAGLFTFDFSDLSGGTAAGTTYTLVDFGSTTFSAADFSASGLSGTFTMNAGNLQFTVAAVPEPETYVLVALGGAALLAARRRRGAL